MRQCTLGDLIADDAAGFACGKSNLVEQGVVHLRPFNIGLRGEIDLATTYQIPAEAVPKGRGELRAGDILFNNTNSAELVGKAAIIERDICAGFSNHLTRIRVNEQVALSKYLLYVILDLRQKGTFTAAATQWVSQAAYRVSDLKQLPITLPPLAEQRRIVDILDRAAAVQRLRRAAEEKAREIIPALFVDMFGDPATNPKGWPVGSIGDVLDRIETGKNVMAGSGRSRYRILKVSAVTSGVYDELESKPAPDAFAPDARSVVKAGDFLFSRANTAELVGATTIVDKTDGLTLLPDKLWRLVWKAGVDTAYMLGVLQNSSIRAAISRQASGTSASMRNVSQSKLLSVQFPLAPLEIQRAYAERSQAMAGAKALSIGASRFANSIQQAVTSSLFLAT